jgi:hypothetical protein
MNPNPHNPTISESVRNSGEETLRLIASLPAPAGLEGRVHKALRAAPRRGRVLAWPTGLRSIMRPKSTWMRAAAAAAIVFVVVGGGWGVYTRVQHGQPAKVIVLPPHVPASGGFSGAGAMRTPQTLPGPRATPAPKTRPAQTKGAKKPAAPATSTGAGTGQPAAAVKSADQPAANK